MRKKAKAGPDLTIPENIRVLNRIQFQLLRSIRDMKPKEIVAQAKRLGFSINESTIYAWRSQRTMYATQKSLIIALAAAGKELVAVDTPVQLQNKKSNGVTKQQILTNYLN